MHRKQNIKGRRRRLDQSVFGELLWEYDLDPSEVFWSRCRLFWISTKPRAEDSAVIKLTKPQADTKGAYPYVGVGGLNIGQNKSWV